MIAWLLLVLLESWLNVQKLLGNICWTAILDVQLKCLNIIVQQNVGHVAKIQLAVALQLDNLSQGYQLMHLFGSRDMIATGCEDKCVRVFYVAASTDLPLKVFSGKQATLSMLQ